jgi:carbamoyltransferase
MGDNIDFETFLGLGKTTFNSTICALTTNEIQIWQTERYSRVKADGKWPEQILNIWEEYRKETSNKSKIEIAENRDVLKPSQWEEQLNSQIPFKEYLQKSKLGNYSTLLNDDVKFNTHHNCHAQVGKFFSPFSKALIVVIDGAGNRGSTFSSQHLEIDNVSALNNEMSEECSLYLLDDGELRSVKKYWQKFYQSLDEPEHWYSEGIGTCYEKVAEYIFDSKRAAGKVMGLASFGKVLPYPSGVELLNSLDWSKSYKGKSKEDWESSPNRELYENIAASVQFLYEKRLEEIIEGALLDNPGYSNVILVGGCALNCVANMKLVKNRVVDNVHIPPNPGDEGISFGAALNLYYKKNKWKPFPIDDQHAYWGAKKSNASKSDIEEMFQDYSIEYCSDVALSAAKLLEKNNIIAWFQGRSECGPRALGNRSLLARVDWKGLKDHLNQEIKFREEFRPYGCSTNVENFEDYFEVDSDFRNPFMSFAVKVKNEWLVKFKEVSHIDGTSRIQIVTPNQNQIFHRLIVEVGKLTGIYAVLNTSLNIMGEPIVETIIDAKNFLNKSKVDYLVINDFIIKKNKE